MTDNTWFFKAQKNAMEILNQMCTNKSCQWQLITDKRVIESYTVKRPGKDVWDFVEVHYIKEDDNVRTLIADILYTHDYN